MGEIQVPFGIEPELFKTLTSRNEVGLARSRLQYLVTLFKEKYEKFFPVKISNPADFLYLMHLSFSLENLSTCKGFCDHINEFENNIESAYLVTVLANHLKSRSKILELEPIIQGWPKRPDIRIDFDDTDLYIECKDPKKDILAELLQEQDSMYRVLCSRISRPCDVMIGYESRLTPEQLGELGDFLERRLPDLTGEGTILDRDGIEVSVTNVRDSFQDIGDVLEQFILENRYSERNAITIINRKGIPIAFCKKGVSVIKNITKQLKESRKKVPEHTPLVVTIQSEYLTGHIGENMKAISRLFQPRKYRSFNGVLLLNWAYNFDNLIHMNFNYINNPYAKNALKDIEQLFRAPPASAAATYHRR